MVGDRLDSLLILIGSVIATTTDYGGPVLSSVPGCIL